jgi:hypothetical protein
VRKHVTEEETGRAEKGNRGRGEKQRRKRRVQRRNKSEFALDSSL